MKTKLPCLIGRVHDSLPIHGPCLLNHARAEMNAEPSLS